MYVRLASLRSDPAAVGAPACAAGAWRTQVPAAIGVATPDTPCAPQPLCAPHAKESQFRSCSSSHGSGLCIGDVSVWSAYMMHDSRCGGQVS